MLSAALAELVAALPDDVAITEGDRMEKYRRDRAGDPNAGCPLAVVRAERTEHVQAALRWASTHRVAVVTRGAGTGLSGGATARSDAIVLCTERMRAIHLDPMTRVAVVGPGLFNAEVKAAAVAVGLWYPPDPSSYEICSIGGNVATNAGGLCCVKYGVTGDYVLGLEVVLADGTALRLGGPRLKDTAGLSLVKLIVGSEGILGVVTEVTLRLLPAQPPAATAVASFADDSAATAAVLAIAGSMRPSALEYMDSVAINAVEDVLRMGLDRSAAALLIAQTDTPGAAGAAELSVIAETLRAHGALETFATIDAAEGEAFLAARRAVIPAVERRGRLLLEDVGVPLPRLAELVEGVHRIGVECDTEIALIAHAGDGNTHPLLVVDPADPGALDRAEIAFGEIMELAIALGGTITGEHGVGTLKRPWLVDQLGEDVLALTRRIKAAFDPLGVLNPGVII